MTASRLLAALGPLLLLGACAGAPDMPVAACKDQCQSHSDGYEWAQRSNLGDDEACAGYPTAFVEGCKDGVDDFRMLQPSSKGI